MSDLSRPTKASDVEIPDDRTDEQKRQHAIAQEVRRRRARREAMRQAGADVAPSSADLAARLEASATKAREASIMRFKAKQVAARQLREKRS